jgi:hypothetical protein
MSDDFIIKPVAQRAKKSNPIGRRADKVAMFIAALGAISSILAAVWFFSGFAENDSRPEHLASAVGLTLGLFAFAIIPFLLVAAFARRAYLKGPRRAHMLWTLLLMLPWGVLGSLAISYTPLPVWCGVLIVGLAILLSFWAVMSLVLESQNSEVDTEMSQ